MSVETTDLEADVSDNPVLTGQSRRALFTAFGLAAAAGAVKTAAGQSEKVGELTPTQLRNRLLRRITYGPSELDSLRARTIGYDAYVDEQLNYEAIDDSACENKVAWYSTVHFSERDLFKVREDVAKHELTAATMVRAIHSKRQLYQRMVEFWTDHFNVYFDKVGVLKVVHDREVIRKHALGNFRDMLMANTKSPAILVYLDNDPSSRLSPNQNLAREMMELHSLGSGIGYTQTDVINVAKCLTGWTVRLWPWDAPDIGQFVFEKNMHHNGIKTVFGKIIEQNGWIKDGETVVRLICAKKHVGRFLARKLCMFFLGSVPSSQLVEEIADIYMDTHGEIKPMVKAVLRQENMAASNLMVKRPFHLSMGLMRQAQPTIGSYWPLRDELARMSQHPFEWAPPNGYPAAEGYWAPGLLNRWNFCFDLFLDQIDEMSVNRKTICKNAIRVEDVLMRINTLFFQGEMNAQNRAAVKAILGDDTTAYGKSLGASARATALPGYQKC